MNKLIITIAFVLCFHLLSKAQCSCYTVEGLEIVGQDSMLLQLSNACDNNVYLNLYVISIIAPFDTLGRQEIWNAFIFPFNTIVDNILSTDLTIAPELGTYRVSITNGSLVCDSIAFSPTLSIQKKEPVKLLSVYPNPSNGDLFIDLGLVCKSVKISVTNISGQLVQSNEFEDIQKLNLHLNQAAGMYYINIASEKFNSVVKCIKK